MNSKSILIGLNEINFDFLDDYIKQGRLKNFAKLLNESKVTITKSESEYHLLEPWIQWVTIHTGKTYAEHNVYRLGDIVDKKDLSQIFEELEKQGVSIGAVSPFNVDNRLKNPKFFIPDPWTKTKVSGNWFVKNLYKAIHQSVNDNAQEKISITSLLTLAYAFVFYAPLSKWPSYFSNIINRKKPGSRAIILDNLLIDVFIKLWKKNKPDFTNIFLNSGAHIQHHYLLNSISYKGNLKNPDWYCPEGYDPLLKILNVYDKFIGQILNLDKDLKIFIATGLHQKPPQKITFYWRLKQHESFIKEIGIDQYKEILPRMSRDFLINFSNAEASQKAEIILNSFKSSGDAQRIFNVDNRGTSLFVELVYEKDIDDSMNIVSSISGQEVKNFKKYISFVAIKNGEHDGIGYLTSNVELNLAEEIELKEVKDILKQEILS